MKRFYVSAGVEAVPGQGGYAVTLDGRPIRTPGRRPLVLTNRAVADAIAEEWQAQGDEVDPRSMPLMSLAATAIDRVTPNRPQVIANVAAYGATDLLCYRAATPAELVARQEAIWQPLLDWAHATHGAALRTTTGITPIEQPSAAMAALTAAIEAHDDLALAALGSATAAAGSLIVGLALSAGHITPDEAFAISQLDETYQAEKWGEDPEAQAAREVLKTDLSAAKCLLALMA